METFGWILRAGDFIFCSGVRMLGGSRSHKEALASVLPMHIQGWFPLGLFGLISLQSQGPLRVFRLQHNNLKTSVLQCSAFLMVQLSHPYLTTRKAIGLTIWDQIANICWIMEKAREFQKTSVSLTMPKPLTVWITINCGKFFKRWN